MSSDNRGQWQAQGDDVAGTGHTCPWNEQVPPSKVDANSHLDKVCGLCTAQQLSLRDEVAKKARRYISRAPAEGVPAFHMKSFMVMSPPLKAKRARIDLEITTGSALCDPILGKEEG